VSGATIGTSGTTASGTTTSTTGTATTGTTTTGTTTTFTGADTPNVAATGSSTANTASTSNVAGGGSATAFGTNTTTDINAATPGNSFAPGGSFSNDSGNTALGTSPGQTSSGTFAGNSSNGIGADSSTLNNSLNNGTTTANNATLVPEGSVSVIGGGAGGSRVVGAPGATQQQGTTGSATATPLFDQAAREGRAREARRRAKGDEPRVYGIAPNTERDLTWQMPDDRIIRY
jgi:hypothetical protein